MKIEKVKEVEPCMAQYSYCGSKSKINEKIDEAVFALRKAKISGFRPGKAPDHIIKIKCRNEIDAWVKREMIVQAYDDIVFEQKIKPIGQPKLESASLNKSDFNCVLTICSRPEFELAEYKEMDLPSPHIAMDALEQKEKALHDLRMRLGDAEPYSDGDFVAHGHQVTMDVVAECNGEPYPEACAEGILYTIGDNKIPGLDDSLLGMLPDEEREFALTLNGKEVNFKVKIHMGMKTIPHELNDEFATKLGVASLEELEKTLKVMADNKIKEAKNSQLKNQVSKRLLLDNEFEAPAFLVDQEARFLCSKNGLEWSNVDDEMKETFKKSAAESVRLGIIIQCIRDAEPTALISDNEALNIIKNNVQASGQNVDAFIAMASKNGSLHGMLSILKDNYVLEWIVDKAKVME